MEKGINNVTNAWAWGMRIVVVDGEMIKLTADDGWDENVFNGIVYRKHNGTNFYLTDDEDGMYLVKGSD